jgi:hypothetical protein
MSKGDKLLRKRDELLRYLYDQGAIAPISGVDSVAAQEALQVDVHDMESLYWTLHAGELIGGGRGRGQSIWLTPDGFERASKIKKKK